ncbi:MAG TPA: PAS domain-containing protein [Actinomycetota bacterium]|nr:PAS domain-containing protein [Actinomycetota bacterium]
MDAPGFADGPQPLRALIVEDTDDDAQLLVRELRLGGYAPVYLRVETPEQLAGALDEGGWDVVLCDYRMGSFEAPQALRLIQERGLDLPFIVVSGTVGEDLAVEMMRAGAHDYLMKGSLARLAPAVRRELREAQVRRERREAERRLREAEERYRALVERVPAVIYLAEPGRQGRWLYVSPRIEQLLGYTPEEWLADPGLWIERLHPADRERVLAEEDRRLTSSQPIAADYRFVARDGRTVWVHEEAEVIEDERGRRLLWGLIHDVTAEREAEERLRRSDQQRRRLLAKLVTSQEEERTRVAHDIHDDSIQVMTAVGMRLEVLRRRLRDPEDLRVLEQLAHTVAAAISRLRNLLFELRPPALDREGLASALRMHLREMEPGPRCRLDDRLTREPSPEVRAVAYRIAQEALANVRKHARASSVEVAVRDEGAGVLVEVRDDGAGFDPGAVEEAVLPGHLGLVSMRERAELAGGWLRVESAPGRGTCVRAWLPLEAGSPASPEG